MKNYTYNFEIRNMIIQFMAALDDIIISRYNKDRAEQSRIKTRVVYAPKQRVLADLLDKAQNIQLPVVSVYITGVNRDENRVYNKIQGTTQRTGSGTAKILTQPTPIDIGVGVTVLTRFQEDMDQILTNIVPYFDPYIVISWRTQFDPLHEIRSQVYWSGSASVQYPYEVASTSVQRVQAELGFTIKGWLFKGDSRQGPAEAPVIFQVNSSYSTERNNLNGPYTENGSPYSTDTTDYFTLSGIPILKDAVPKILPATSSYVSVPTGNIIVSGAGSTAVNGIYAPDGTNDGKTKYLMPGGNKIEWNTFGVWSLTEFIPPAGFGFRYSSSNDVATPDLVTTWTLSMGGALPLPTVTAEMISPEEIEIPYPTLISVKSRNLLFVGDVYVMSFTHIPGSTLYNSFSAVPSLSAVYPSISALKIENFITDNESNLTFVFPLTSVPAGAVYDIVVENPAGRAILSSALSAQS